MVTGWGAVSPLGSDADTIFTGMAAGRSGVRRVDRFDPTGLFCDIAGQLDDDALLPVEDAESAGSGWRPVNHALQAALAMRPLEGDIAPERIAVVLGGHGEHPTADEVAHLATLFEEGHLDVDRLAADEAFDPRMFLRRDPQRVPLHVADAVGARGPVLSIVSACAAGTQAIGEATRMLRTGQADIVVAGGGEPLLSWTTFLGFALLGALTRRYPSPEGASRPFDRKRNGFVIAEGAGLVILETLEHATACGHAPRGEVLGYGDSADGYRITDVHPEGGGAIQAIEGALHDSKLTADAVDYVNAHGTSTPTNDPVETKAVKAVLGERAYDVPISSNKSMIGHTIGAAGALEAIMTWKGMEESLLLPTINYQHPDRKCDLDYVPNEARQMAYRVALSNSFGFGGQNGCLCLGAAP